MENWLAELIKLSVSGIKQEFADIFFSPIVNYNHQIGTKESLYATGPIFNGANIVIAFP